MRDTILNIDNLTIGYKSRRNKTVVAENLKTSMNRGELSCLLGSNGAGKSTLIKTICGFQASLGGSISINNTPIEKLSERKLSTLISVVLTDRVHVPNATVEEIVGYGRSPHTGIMGRLNKDDIEIVLDSMTKSGIIHKRKNLINELSDGERQKVFIAKAIAQDTPIILLDEPTAFLDLPAKVEIMQLLREIASKTGKSILMSTHDLNLALQLADQLWLLQTGGILKTGTPEQLLLENTFQAMFQRNGILFDNKTGLFVVKHKEQSTVQIKGVGFEQILLCRALARKGIKSTDYTETKGLWIDVNSETNTFSIQKDNDIIESHSSIENVVNHFVKLNA